MPRRHFLAQPSAPGRACGDCQQPVPRKRGARGIVCARGQALFSLDSFTYRVARGGTPEQEAKGVQADDGPHALRSLRAPHQPEIPIVNCYEQGSRSTVSSGVRMKFERSLSSSKPTAGIESKPDVATGHSSGPKSRYFHKPNRATVLCRRSAQFSTCKPGTWRKSFRLRVTKVARLASVMAAMSKSDRPILLSFLFCRNRSNSRATLPSMETTLGMAARWRTVWSSHS